MGVFRSREIVLIQMIRTIRRGVWMVCVFAELAVPSLRAEPARSAGPEPTITRRSHQRAGGDEAASREHSRSGAPSAAAEGSKSLSHRCAQNSGLGDWSAKPSWNGGAQDCECALLRMQPAPNSHRSGSPKDAEPDDFGASPIVGTLPNGKTILVAGQRPGSFGRDPDRKCAFLWKTSVASTQAALRAG